MTADSRPRVLLTRRVPSSILSRLEAVCDVQLEETALTPEQLRERIRDKDGLISVLTDRVDEALLEAAPALKVVANIAANMDGTLPRVR